ncbi:hypothetical protein [Microbacterium sp.]|uniref:hypothetical protein n=1 Tax=Microbacterium sp. TaxID=51671 RepID=UPI002811A215|nr:hypothetical protein [Microbacterium sp.]
MPYEAQHPQLSPSAVELRARVPGWGSDAPDEYRHTADEREDLGPTGAHWSFPDRQADDPARERSIEHAMLTPVYGTAQPLHGLSGAVRRLAYSTLSEARNTRWLLLILGDRIEATGAHLRSLFTVRPDNPLTQTGILSEPHRRPIASRFGRGRLDLRHSWIDPIIVAGPWIAAVAAIVAVARRALRR